MKVMLLAFLTAAALAVAADFALDRAGFSSQEAASGPTVRLD